jgi:hypothetical protein
MMSKRRWQRGRAQLARESGLVALGHGKEARPPTGRLRWRPWRPWFARRCQRPTPLTPRLASASAPWTAASSPDAKWRGLTSPQVSTKMIALAALIALGPVTIFGNEGCRA